MKFRVILYVFAALALMGALALGMIGLRGITAEPMDGIETVPSQESPVTEPSSTQPTIADTVPEPTVPAGPTATEPPETEPPITEPPVTEPPATKPAVTQPPTTKPPATKPAATQPPVTIPPVTQPPVTQPPATQPPATEPQKVFPELTAKTAFVYDSRIDEYLYLSGSKDKSLYPASTTKLFTTYVAMWYLQPDAVLTVGDEIDFISAGATVVDLRKGDRITAEATAKCALLPSGCDASYVLAAAAGRAILADPSVSADAAVGAFMAKVNEWAAQLGMTNTYFVTPDGYHHKDHKISVDSFATIAQCCMEDPLISQIVGTASAQISVTNDQGQMRTIKLKNTNKNLDPKSPYYTDACIGLKTGYTSRAGVCLLGAYRVEGGYLIIGVFGCPTLESRYPDALALFKYYSE